MTESLRQIVYISRAAPVCDDEEVRAIGRLAQIRNEECGITGLLLFDGARFIQAIEGPSDAVRSTMHRIYADHRHSQIHVANDRQVDDRQFGPWSMQTRKTPAGACSPSFLRKVKEIMKSVDDTSLRALFIGFTVLGTSVRQ